MGSTVRTENSRAAVGAGRARRRLRARRAQGLSWRQIVGGFAAVAGLLGALKLATPWLADEVFGFGHAAVTVEGDTISVQGPISYRSGREIVGAIEARHGRPVRLALDSTGGRIHAASTIMAAIRAHGQVEAIVEKARYCGSACTAIFAQAQERHATWDTVLMFHSAQLPYVMPGFTASTMSEDFEHAYRGASEELWRALTHAGVLDSRDVELTVSAFQLVRIAPDFLDLIPGPGIPGVYGIP
jgi:hypothetical protein